MTDMRQGRFLVCWIVSTLRQRTQGLWLLHGSGRGAKAPAVALQRGAAEASAVAPAGDDQYMRMFMTFDTGAERYAWLNEHLFVARGRLAGAAEIEYEIYRVL